MLCTDLYLTSNQQPATSNQQPATNNMNDWKDRLGVVFSTNNDFDYTHEQEEEQETLPPKQQILKVSLDRKKRKGKSVTLIANFIGSSDHSYPVLTCYDSDFETDVEDGTKDGINYLVGGNVTWVISGSGELESRNDVCSTYLTYLLEQSCDLNTNSSKITYINCTEEYGENYICENRDDVHIVTWNTCAPL